MNLWIKNGRVIDPANGIDAIQDIFVSEGLICEADKFEENYCQIIDAEGMWVTPGLIDLHVHLREPGYEHKETIATGAKSAAAGGFTSICCMPNTNPVIDSPEGVEFILQQANAEFHVNVIPVGSITKGQKGEELSDIEGMYKSGALAISEDGKTVTNAKLVKEAMKECQKLGIAMFSHCEDVNLVNNGCMNEGKSAENMGLNGISNDSEEVIVARDIALAQATGARLHICHVSTAGSCQLIRDGQGRDIAVSAEVSPHHLVLDDSYIDGTDANFKMNPPLRSKKDVEAVIKALADGTIQVIATDHAPHHVSEKSCSFEKAANGIIGLETALGLCITYLVNKDILTPKQLIEKMSLNPAKILGIDKGNLSIGKVADITIIDPTEKWIVKAEDFHSKAQNTPFQKWELEGRAKYTIVGGIPHTA